MSSIATLTDQVLMGGSIAHVVVKRSFENGITIRRKIEWWKQHWWNEIRRCKAVQLRLTKKRTRFKYKRTDSWPSFRIFHCALVYKGQLEILNKFWQKISVLHIFYLKFDNKYLKVGDPRWPSCQSVQFCTIFISHDFTRTINIDVMSGIVLEISNTATFVLDSNDVFTSQMQ